MLLLFKTPHCNHEQIKYLLYFKKSLVLCSLIFPFVIQFTHESVNLQVQAEKCPFTNLDIKCQDVNQKREVMTGKLEQLKQGVRVKHQDLTKFGIFESCLTCLSQTIALTAHIWICHRHFSILWYCRCFFFILKILLFNITLKPEPISFYFRVSKFV